MKIHSVWRDVIAENLVLRATHVDNKFIPLWRAAKLEFVRIRAISPRGDWQIRFADGLRYTHLRGMQKVLLWQAVLRKKKISVDQTGHLGAFKGLDVHKLVVLGDFFREGVCE